MKFRVLNKIYIVHYTKLIDRKKYLENKLEKLKINVEWVDQFDREIVTQKQIDEIYEFDATYTDIHIDSITSNPPIRPLRISELCNYLSHYYCIQNHIKNDFDYTLVLEDDVIFENNAFLKVNEILNKMPSDCDICYLGNGCGLKPSNIENDKIFYDTSFGIKAADSIIYTKKAAKFLSEKKRTHRPIDYHINTFRNELKIYWVEPPIFLQGSQNGIYKTAVQTFDFNWI
jgi:GR25 family glycosyltransferase involved in LPS biosynthesis